MPLRRKTRLAALFLALSLLSAGCGPTELQTGSAPEPQTSVAPEPPAEDTGTREPFVPYEAPPMATAVFHPEKAEGGPEAMVDLSALSEGYVAVSATSDKRLKFQVIMGEWTYTYDLASDGTPSVFPLQCGDGHYTFRVMENVSENKYVQAYITECDVKLLDEFQPFLRPNDYSRYDAQSAAVHKAAELAAACTGKLEVVSAVYAFVCDNIRYDEEKALTVTSGYLPDVDETLRSGKGICFDYSALAAAMLRSQGIPTKIIFGYVAPDELYHAWNMFYTDESGWITVSFEVSADSWNRIDLTFSAGGTSDAFVGDGSHYTDVFIY